MFTHVLFANLDLSIILWYLGPYTPELAALTVRCQGVTPPVLHGSIRVQPRWTGYDITEIRINITYSDNGVVLQRETTIPYNDQKECHYFNETLSGCVDSLSNFSVLVSAITISSTYGESVPSPPVEARIDKGTLIFLPCNLCLGLNPKMLGNACMVIIVMSTWHFKI